MRGSPMKRARIRPAHFARFALVAALLGCLPEDIFNPGGNPFASVTVIPRDGLSRELDSALVGLGLLVEGDVIRLEVTGEGVTMVQVLIADSDANPQAGIIVGGGPPDEVFDFRVPRSSRYYAYVSFRLDVPENERLASLSYASGHPGFTRPERQVVVVRFEPDFLTNPGLVDPTSFTAEETQLLEDITELVRNEIVSRLQLIFAGTPVEIVDERDPAPAGPFSVLTFDPAHVPQNTPTIEDVAIPGADPDSPCYQPVIFGRVLPEGANFDAGNFNKSDQAVVYVGSFQGRGAECRYASLNSLNHIVLALSQTGAHEIGHLVGFQHVPLVDIMDRRVTAAFQRMLEFGRRQTLVETPVRNFDGTIGIVAAVQTSIIQDPELYYEANFDWIPAE